MLCVCVAEGRRRPCVCVYVANVVGSGEAEAGKGLILCSRGGERRSVEDPGVPPDPRYVHICV